ncbi:MAG: DNA/RNA non-specific endonuclease [Acidobacteria bacterium]|nr:DNA/RNA non-specific endonuclease [Acidobacteriota bacterium]
MLLNHNRPPRRLAAHLLAIETLGAQPNRFGLPACNAPDQQLATRTAFTLGHSNTHKVPLWTAYQFAPEMLTAPSAPRQHFRRGPELAASATDANYRHSGFHRSHLVPALCVRRTPLAGNHHLPANLCLLSCPGGLHSVEPTWRQYSPAFRGAQGQRKDGGGDAWPVPRLPWYFGHPQVGWSGKHIWKKRPALTIPTHTPVDWPVNGSRPK